LLDEQFELHEEWREDEDGCIVVVDQTSAGERLEFHHQIPDDTAPHVPSTECGCGPQATENPDGVILFTHVDQDEPEDAWADVMAST
jgi:hypothetical protein